MIDRFSPAREKGRDKPVFGDRLNKRARKKLFKQADEHEAEFPGEWPVGPSAG